MVKNWILKIFAMTFTFDLQIWFKVTEHTFPKSSVFVMFEPDRAEGREYIWSEKKVIPFDQKYFVGEV